MQASVLLFHWGSYCWACNLLVLIIYLFFLPVMLSSVFPRLATDSAGRVFPGVWTLLFLKVPSRDRLPFPGRSSLPTSFVSFFVFYIFSYLFLKTMVCFSGCLMSSASLQKLFCGVCSALKCSFEEFVREKVVFPSYSSAILGPPCDDFYLIKTSIAEKHSEWKDNIRRRHLGGCILPPFSEGRSGSDHQERHPFLCSDHP